MKTHGDFLLEKNIRKYLGLNKNRVNFNIQSTLIEEEKRKNFYFFNNGITILCKKFSHNALMGENWQLKIDDIQIVNGGQTSKTILETVLLYPEIDFSQTSVLVRIYEVSEEDQESVSLTTDITIATNSQTPVDLRDLRANDSKQKSLVLSMKELGYDYITKKGFNANFHNESIPSSVGAESVFAIWKKKPHLAKYKRSELFGKYYEEVFDNINASHVILATIIFRFCDSNRKKRQLIKEHKHISYSNYYLAMICGEFLLKEKLINLAELNHVNLKEMLDFWNLNKDLIYSTAIKKLNDSMKVLFPNGINEIDPRRLAATFRRGDLLSILED